MEWRYASIFRNIPSVFSFSWPWPILSAPRSPTCFFYFWSGSWARPSFLVFAAMSLSTCRTTTTSWSPHNVCKIWVKYSPLFHRAAKNGLPKIKLWSVSCLRLDVFWNSFVFEGSKVNNIYWLPAGGVDQTKFINSSIFSRIIRKIKIVNMQNMINAVKGSALGVAEYLTPVLKVRYIGKSLIFQSLIQISALSLCLILSFDPDTVWCKTQCSDSVRFCFPTKHKRKI